MRLMIGLAIVAGGVTLAVVIGQRMSTDAMAVVVGVVFGVAASIPTSLLIVAATRGRRDESRYSSTAARSMAQTRGRQPWRRKSMLSARRCNTQAKRRHPGTSPAE